MLLNLSIDEIIQIIKHNQYKKIGLQFPEGLKRQSIEISKKIEKNTDVEIIISGNPCFGACDIDTNLANEVDILFHFGHSEIKKYKNIVFIEAVSDIDVIQAVEVALSILKSDKIGIITTIQHVHKIRQISEYLEKKGKIALIGKGDNRIKYPGQVLGCNFSAARIECDEYLFIGSGMFHPLGVAIATKKTVIASDPYLKKAIKVEPERFMRIRYGYIASSMDAKVFGIIVSTKPGQKREKLAKQLKKIAQKHDKSAYIIQMDLITPENLIQFSADVYVNTACPRITIDDAQRFHVPVLTPQEFKVAIGEINFEELEIDEIKENSE